MFVLFYFQEISDQVPSLELAIVEIPELLSQVVFDCLNMSIKVNNIAFITAFYIV